MAWCEGLEETRLFVASSGFRDPSVSEDDKEQILAFCHPKTGGMTCYLLINGNLQELNWFKQHYGSWFMGDYICEDGSLYASTPVDPVFVLLPMFDEARMKNGDDDPGKFRQLDEIIYLNDHPGYHHLALIAEKSMEVVCDCKEIGSTKFFRLNDLKVLDWMYCKVQQLKQALLKLDGNYAARSQKDILADAVMIMGEYLKDEPWLKLLRNHLRLNIDEAVQVPDTEGLSSAACSSLNPIQMRVDKRVTRNGKQNKMAKVEKNSQSIKDMFSRASRRGR